ncbi:hypothetical protein E2562_006119 [Oryza meyeriana var. granulata]|uniref:Uncharacterized protein n=1 Tax=Oryza meyeriana var. granulata TaxID=110450 RepID=A0A6G1EVN4_9ORYZ|nr:hypothetical protein E2562_006119 [Oryza meyeriana var. granulata]
MAKLKMIHPVICICFIGVLSIPQEERRALSLQPSNDPTKSVFRVCDLACSSMSFHESRFRWQRRCSLPSSTATTPSSLHGDGADAPFPPLAATVVVSVIPLGAHPPYIGENGALVDGVEREEVDLLDAVAGSMLTMMWSIAS